MRVLTGFTWSKEPPTEPGTYWLRHPQALSWPTLFAIVAMSELSAGKVKDDTLVVVMAGSDQIQQREMLNYLAMQGAEFSAKLTPENSKAAAYEPLTLEAQLQALVARQVAHTLETTLPQMLATILKPQFDAVVYGEPVAEVVEPPQGIAWAGVPKWATAPEWALWWALNANGRAFWHESKPQLASSVWFPRARQYLAGEITDAEMLAAWPESLQERPAIALPVFIEPHEWEKSIDGTVSADEFFELGLVPMPDEEMAEDEAARLIASYINVQPDWETAPSWANWWAIDGDGVAWWHEKQPTWRTFDDADDADVAGEWQAQAHALYGRDTNHDQLTNWEDRNNIAPVSLRERPTVAKDGEPS